MIGIKIADGSFYPILEEGKPGEKRIEVTTVRDDQTTVQINLYRSSSGNMDDADYVDTLLIDNLVPHPKEEPSFGLVVKIDENNMLSAEIDDPETGEKSDTNVSLVNMGNKSIFDEPDYKVTPEEQQEKQETTEDSSDFSLTESSDSDTSDLDNLLDDFSFDMPEETSSVESEEVVDSADNSDFDISDDFSLPEESVAEEPVTDDFVQRDEPVTVTEEPVIEEPVAESVLSDDDFSFSSDFLDEDKNMDEDEKPFSFDSLPDFDEIPELSGSSRSENVIDDDLDIDFSIPEENNNITNEDSYTNFTDTQPEYEYAPRDNMQNVLFGSDDLFEETKKQNERKVLIPVIICILCAVISLGVLGVILYLTPSIMKIAGKGQQEETAANELLVAEAESQNENAQPSLIAEKTPVVRQSEENRIVVLNETVPPVVPENKTNQASNIIRHLVKWGDTLWDLAGFYYRNPWLFRIISDANNLENPDFILSGTYLTIPER